MSSKPSVVFLCIHNAGRSQIAAAWMRHLAGESVTVGSGGSEPGDRVNPLAVEVMSEVGIDLTAAVPAAWSDDMIRSANVVVTMGCGDVCPIFPGVEYEDWDLTNPSGQPIEVVREVRDEIRRRVEDLARRLGVSDGSRV